MKKCVVVRRKRQDNVISMGNGNGPVQLEYRQQKGVWTPVHAESRACGILTAGAFILFVAGRQGEVLSAGREGTMENARPDLHSDTINVGASCWL